MRADIVEAGLTARLLSAARNMLAEELPLARIFGANYSKPGDGEAS